MDADEPAPGSLDGPAAVRSVDGFRIGLKRRSEFQRASKGRRFHARALGLQVLFRTEEPVSAPRFGLTVTKRVGNSVERNRIKRRFRAALRMPDVTAKAGHDYVIVARRDALSLPFAGLVADLMKTLDQAGSGRASKRPGRPPSKPNVSP